MSGPLSEFLNSLELQGQNWCFITMGARTGFHLPHCEAVFFHAFLEGTTRVTIGAGQVFECKAGDIAIILPGDAHKVRNRHGRTSPTIDMLLDGDASVDAPPTIGLGGGHIANRLLSGRLDIRWPNGFRPHRLPTMLTVPSTGLGLDFRHFVRSATGPGSAALLTRMAALLFVATFRNDPLCRAQVQGNLRDPIARARLLIEKHPYGVWNVASLAARVGMGRSNFATRFAAQVGRTPIDMLNAERMKHAQRILGDTSLKIAEVCERVGFRSEVTFIRRFTAHFGTTPGQWRRMNRESPVETG